MNEKPKGKQPKLKARQRAFIDAYLANGFNGTQAAITAGYSKRTARVIASENLTKPAIAEEIETRMKALAMSADEVLYRLSEHGRGDLRELMGLTTEELKEHPKGWLLKKHKVWRDTDEEGNVTERVEIEIHDPQAALDKLGRYHKLFTERVEHSGKDGQSIPITLVEIVRPSDETPLPD